MRSRFLRSALVTVCAFAFAVLFAPLAHAQDAAAPAAPALTAAPDAPAFVLDFIAQHAWTSIVLTVFGALTVVYQALIAWAHQRAAATADDADDKWLASLEAKPWFRLLDRIFYWGGYLGAKLGGRKL